MTDYKPWGPTITGSSLKLKKGCVLVRPDPEHEVSDGGIIYSKAKKHSLWKGTVIGNGPDNMITAEGTLKDGDRILFSIYAGERLIFNGENVTIVSDPEEIVGTIQE